MATNGQAVNQVKLWIYPTLVGILGMIIWHDVRDIKNDVKQLMAQSNIDKTRIDNLERQIERLMPSKTVTLSGLNPYNPLNRDKEPKEAVIPKDLYIDNRQKKYILGDVIKKKRNIV